MWSSVFGECKNSNISNIIVTVFCHICYLQQHDVDTWTVSMEDYRII